MPLKTIENENILSEFQNVWEISVDKNSIFSQDDVINAYLKGKEIGIKENIFLDKLNENIEKSAKFTKSMLTFLKNNNFNPISAHLKINAFDDFIILITVPEDELIKEEFLITYNFSANIENQVIDDKYFNLMFMFSDREKHTFNKELLVSDGFFMDYNIKKADV